MPSYHDQSGAFWRALELQRRVLHQLNADVAALAAANPRLATMLNVFPTMTGNAAAALDSLVEASEHWDDKTMATINAIVEQSGVNSYCEAYLSLEEVYGADELKKKNGTGQEAVATLGKVFGLLSEIPGIGIIFSIVAKILDIVSQFLEGEASATEAERQLEEKLHQLSDRLGRVITGESIPVGSGTIYTPEKPPVKQELEDIERGLAYIMDLPQGQPFPEQPAAGSDVRPVSLTDIRNFLAYIADVPQGQDFPPPPAGDSNVRPVSLTDISILLNILIEGLAFAVDLPPGQNFPPRPPVGTPVSLTDIEKKLDFIMDFEPGEGRVIPPVPPGVKPVSLTMLNGTVKKIYVVQEGVFAAGSPADSQVIQVRAQPAPPTVNLSPAFDLSGWLDLSEMRDGDLVTVAVDVQFAGRPAVRFRQTTFGDRQPLPLKHFRDFADGVQQVVGTSVDISLTQRQSADGFATPVNLAYQFIVESP
ncbi:MAG: hypothetical protein AB1648_04750 [Pseudomonadota bacterium]